MRFDPRAAVLASCLCLACHAVVGEAPLRPGAEEPSSVQSVPGGRRVWRLTRAQYDNTVADLLGDASSPARSFIDEEGGTGFDNTEASLGFTSAHYAQFIAAAERLAAETVEQRLDRVFPCGTARLNDSACARQFVEDFGRRAFRRPLSGEERDAFLAVHAQARDAIDGRTAVQLVIEGMLESPSFLFRTEIGPTANDAQRETVLDPYELASALSYGLWNTMPDDALFAAAAEGRLSTRDDIEREARRMLDDPRARPVVADFVLQLIGYRAIDALTKNPAMYPDFAAAQPHLVEETRRFIDAVVFEEDGDLATLLPAPFTFVNAATAGLYGVTPPPDGWSRVELDPAIRGGLLTQLGFLSLRATATQSSPVRRGHFVTTQLFCLELPDPPEDVVIVEPAPDGARTTRERFAQHSTNPQCRACHQFLDLPGFAFERFDAIGRARAEENGQPINTSAELNGTEDSDGAYAGLPSMAAAIAQSAQVRRCIARQAFRLHSGRLDQPADAAHVEAMIEHAEDNGWNVRELFLAYYLDEHALVRNGAIR